MKKILLTILALFSLNSFAGDMSVYCGQGTIEDMDEFVASALISDSQGKAIVNFTTNETDFTVIYNNGVYTFYLSNPNQYGFISKTMIASGPFHQSSVVNGYSCHLND